MTARSAEDVADKKNLSKNVLQMKFMQKGKVVVVDEAEEMAKRILKNKAHWVVKGLDDQPRKLPYEFDTSLVVCEDLLPIGRMAYSNFNPNVDKIHKEILHGKKVKVRPEKDDDAEVISDEEMAERYETLVQTIDKKFQGKRKHADVDNSSDSDDDSDDDATKALKARAKRGFLKPKFE